VWVAIFSVPKKSHFRDNFDLAAAMSLAVAIVNLFWRHKNDIFAWMQRKEHQGREWIDHTDTDTQSPRICVSDRYFPY
jgi:hypothetical protein